ncbi:GNAT family N-acetyltransferase [Flagellimonas allohymeniacidonis]|uniref:GNAT family N-acetyltransferase n=1 Tax=Flagellimonas allohymeniacidonis TaxID=2517819 RepID=A0A4Q8QG88_9FLAO|nr:GNAT family N-acetyltransferase [Allomuricauda hymeniacidonis]TAI47603.1 GNAT family N-acetyltransferase [Allomuricauda hymeniacidonis]
MFVKHLSDTPFETILDCFLKAFDDYFVKMPTDKDYYQQRWKAAKVDFSSSYGMFDKEKLVGFILHAVDTRGGKLIAFNTGTGVIPEYRGKRIVKSIYEYALTDLAEKGVEKSKLEVITKNKIAIFLYTGIGFNRCKEYKCFNGKLDLGSSLQSELREMDLKDVDWDSLPNQQLYSWENQHESLLEGNCKFFQVWHDQKPESFFVIDPDLNYLAQFDVLTEEKGAWKRLFSAIRNISETIKVNNVDVRLKEKLDALVLFGLENTIDQFEMELEIN